MTQADVPYVPEDVTSIPESRNESCVEITWSPPSVSTGTITGYNVRLPSIILRILHECLCFIEFIKRVGKKQLDVKQEHKW